jgi:hypothetical protein
MTAFLFIFSPHSDVFTLKELGIGEKYIVVLSPMSKQEVTPQIRP